MRRPPSHRTSCTSQCGAAFACPCPSRTCAVERQADMVVGARYMWRASANRSASGGSAPSHSSALSSGSSRSDRARARCAATANMPLQRLSAACRAAARSHGGAVRALEAAKRRRKSAISAPKRPPTSTASTTRRRRHLRASFVSPPLPLVRAVTVQLPPKAQGRRKTPQLHCSAQSLTSLGWEARPQHAGAHCRFALLRGVPQTGVLGWGLGDQIPFVQNASRHWAQRVCVGSRYHQLLVQGSVSCVRTNTFREAALVLVQHAQLNTGRLFPQTMFPTEIFSRLPPRCFSFNLLSLSGMQRKSFSTCYKVIPTSSTPLSQASRQPAPLDEAWPQKRSRSGIGARSRACVFQHFFRLSGLSGVGRGVGIRTSFI